MPPPPETGREQKQSPLQPSCDRARLATGRNQHPLDRIGIRVVASDGAHTRVELDGATDQDVLQAALAAGPVHEFSPYRPPLTELYKDVVSR